MLDDDFILRKKNYIAQVHHDDLGVTFFKYSGDATNLGGESAKRLVIRAESGSVPARMATSMAFWLKSPNS